MTVQSNNLSSVVVGRIERHLGDNGGLSLATDFDLYTSHQQSTTYFDLGALLLEASVDVTHSNDLASPRTSPATPSAYKGDLVPEVM